MNRTPMPRTMAGFSLVELMVALVAGMIVVGAVLAFTVSSVRANSDYVQSTRLMQELRNTTDYMTVELKRAGYDEKAMKYVANPTSTAVSHFAPMKIDTTAGANCIIYAYDTKYDSPNGQGLIDLNGGDAGVPPPQDVSGQARSGSYLQQVFAQVGAFESPRDQPF